MTLSTHKTEVVFINKIEPIPGADKIGVMQVWGYPVVTRFKDFAANDRKLWLYILPDSLVPTNRKEFRFLDDDSGKLQRIRVRKYRKQKSFGLLVQAPSGAKEGDDYASKWGIEHYEPQVKTPTPPKGGYKGRLLRKIYKLSVKYGERPPKRIIPYFDLEALRRFPNLFTSEDIVYISEKLHGSQVVYCWEDRRALYKIKWWLRNKLNKTKLSWQPYYRYLRVRSRKVWRKPTGNVWADSIHESILKLLSSHNDWVVFGEIFGPGVQELTYGVDEPTIAVFDVLTLEGWMPWKDLETTAKLYDLPLVPMLYVGPYDFEKIEKLAEGKTSLNNGPHIREGAVIKSIDETTHPRFGRKALKIIGFDYYQKSD